MQKLHKDGKQQASYSRREWSYDLLEVCKGKCCHKLVVSLEVNKRISLRSFLLSFLIAENTQNPYHPIALKNYLTSNPSQFYL